MSAPISLHQLKRGQSACVVAVTDRNPDDSIARRLRSLGFVPGERLRLQAWGPIGRDPLLIQIGSTRFALRRSEAERVSVTPEGDVA